MALPRQAVFVFMSIRSMQSSTPGAPIGSNTWRGVRGCLESQTQNLGLASEQMAQTSKTMSMDMVVHFLQPPTLEIVPSTVSRNHVRVVRDRTALVMCNFFLSEQRFAKFYQRLLKNWFCSRSFGSKTGAIKTGHHVRRAITCAEPSVEPRPAGFWAPFLGTMKLFKCNSIGNSIPRVFFSPIQ